MDSYISIRLGSCSSYLVRNREHCILVDAGTANQEEKFFTMLQSRGIEPGQLRLIVITHVHYDHVGSLRAIQDACRCPVVVHEREAHLLRDGQVVLPRGTNMFGRAAMWAGKRLFLRAPSLFRFSPVDPEITISEAMSLDEFGFAGGSIIHTPGHTEGSISLVTAAGDAFVGDLALNYLPFGWGPIFPPFADDPKKLLESWDILLEKGVKTVCPGHGRPFDAAKLRRKKERMLGKAM